MVNAVVVSIAGIAIIGLILVFIFVIIWAWLAGRTKDPSTEIVPLSSPVGLLYQCRDYTCQTGSSCDAQAGVCKLNLGQACTKASDCLVGAYCSGVCVNTEPGANGGGPNSPCPCGPTMQCVVGTGSATICKLIQGQTCQNGTDCLSGKCSGGKCTSGLSNGSSCSQSYECVSDNCSLGYCQASGTTTGHAGAVCASGGAPCNAGFSCVDGVCIQATSGIAEPCDTTSTACINPLECLTVPQTNDQGQPAWTPAVACYTDPSITINCQCYYPYTNQQPDPNDCSVSGVCTTPYTCSSGECLGNSGANAPCQVNSQCTGTCNTSPAVIILVYTSYTGIGDTTTSGSKPSDYFSSFDITYNKINNVPAGATRLTGVDSNIFCVVPVASGGVYTVATGLKVVDGTYSSSTSPVAGTTVVTTQNLVDATMYGPSNGFVVFNETTTTTVSGNPNTVTSISGFTVYQLSNGILTPYNVISNPSYPDGVQYTSSNVAINIANIQYEPINQVLGLQDTSGSFWYLSGTKYTAIPDSSTGSTLGSLTQPQWYFDGTSALGPGKCTATCPNFYNIAYIKASNAGNTVVGFNGNAYGANFPNGDLATTTGNAYRVLRYSIYEPDDTQHGSVGLAAGMAAALVQGPSRVSLYIGSPSSGETVPGYFDGTELLLVTSSGVYIYVPGTCN